MNPIDFTMEIKIISMISPLNVLDFTNTHNGTCRVI